MPGRPGVGDDGGPERRTGLAQGHAAARRGDDHVPRGRRGPGAGPTSVSADDSIATTTSSAVSSRNSRR